MAQSKDDITYGTAQARVSEDDALRIRYKAGTPLEGGKIADSEPIDLFSSAHNIERAKHRQLEVDTGSAAKPRCRVVPLPVRAEVKQLVARTPPPELLN